MLRSLEIIGPAKRQANLGSSSITEGFLRCGEKASQSRQADFARAILAGAVAQFAVSPDNVCVQQTPARKLTIHLAHRPVDFATHCSLSRKGKS